MATDGAFAAHSIHPSRNFRQYSTVISELSDDGPGIPAELRAQIFEPFFTTRPGGTGLGLYIARELADANGAALELLPKGPGANFRLTLKRAANPPT